MILFKMIKVDVEDVDACRRRLIERFKAHEDCRVAVIPISVSFVRGIDWEWKSGLEVVFNIYIDKEYFKEELGVMSVRRGVIPNEFVRENMR